jgi:hypothetical protein
MIDFRGNGIVVYRLVSQFVEMDCQRRSCWRSLPWSAWIEVQFQLPSDTILGHWSEHFPSAFVGTIPLKFFSISSLVPGHIFILFFKFAPHLIFPLIILFLFDIILHKDDGANTRQFAISTRDIIVLASTLHITYNFPLKIILFHLVPMSKITKSNHLQIKNLKIIINLLISQKN